MADAIIKVTLDCTEFKKGISRCVNHIERVAKTYDKILQKAKQQEKALKKIGIRLLPVTNKEILNARK